MKKIILSTIYALISLSCNAQIYTSVKYLDKFDDAIKVEQRKSLISKTDSTFVIEEKGKKPVVYYIINSISSGTRGSKDDVVNLVGNVYGYEETWCVVRSDMYDNFLLPDLELLLSCVFFPFLILNFVTFYNFRVCVCVCCDMSSEVFLACKF